MAARFLKVACPGLQGPLYSAAGGSTKSDKLHPYLANILSNRRNWQQPKEMKQPISREMLDTMEAKAQAYTASGTYKNSADYLHSGTWLASLVTKGQGWENTVSDDRRRVRFSLTFQTVLTHQKHGEASRSPSYPKISSSSIRGCIFYSGPTRGSILTKR